MDIVTCWFALYSFIIRSFVMSDEAIALIADAVAEKRNVTITTNSKVMTLRFVNGKLMHNVRFNSASREAFGRFFHGVHGACVQAHVHGRVYNGSSRAHHVAYRGRGARNEVVVTIGDAPIFKAKMLDDAAYEQRLIKLGLLELGCELRIEQPDAYTMRDEWRNLPCGKRQRKAKHTSRARRQARAIKAAMRG